MANNNKTTISLIIFCPTRTKFYLFQISRYERDLSGSFRICFLILKMAEIAYGEGDGLSFWFAFDQGMFVIVATSEIYVYT